MTNEEKARQRVKSSPLLAPYEATIIADWCELEKHLKWVNTASETDILAWAKTPLHPGDPNHPPPL